MTNALAITSLDSFTMSRTSKAGKVSTRNLLGLIIEGTKQEQFESGLLLARESWDNGKLLIVVDTLARVFAGRTWDMSVAFCGLDVAKPSKDKLLALMEAMVRFHGEAKGVKGKYITMCNELVTWAKDEAARKEARRVAYEAEQATLTLEAPVAA
jgi:hypothetical protein